MHIDACLWIVCHIWNVFVGFFSYLVVDLVYQAGQDALQTARGEAARPGSSSTSSEATTTAVVDDQAGVNDTLDDWVHTWGKVLAHYGIFK